MNRDAAWALVCEWTENPNLRKHMLAVEAAMRAYAQRFGEDPELWGLVGLLHDFDYERFPSAEAGHPIRGAEVLQAAGYPDVVTRAILSHASYSGIPRQSLMEKSLYACDELTGFIVAVALVRPHRSLAEVDVSSIRKKLMDKAFARSVNREDIYRGAEEIGLPLDEHISTVLHALRLASGSLGLGPASVSAEPEPSAGDQLGPEPGNADPGGGAGV